MTQLRILKADPKNDSRKKKTNCVGCVEKNRRKVVPSRCLIRRLILNFLRPPFKKERTQLQKVQRQKRLKDHIESVRTKRHASSVIISNF